VKLTTSSSAEIENVFIIVLFVYLTTLLYAKVGEYELEMKSKAALMA
jgi:hypothetical protein